MDHPGNLSARTSRRHYGLDWLRIAAFALLILYHIGMVFAPWDWVVKASRSHPQLIPPMALLTPWRLALLFAVSGYASARLLERSGDWRRFAASRNRRLLKPLAFGMVILVPVEMWVLVRENGYPHGYPHFWAVDYWRVSSFWGRVFPSWEHLWFVVYLWAYTMVLVGWLRWAGPGWRARADALVPWLGERGRLLWAPIALLATVKLALLFVVSETQGLFTDWAGHALYLPMFTLGFAFATRPVLWQMAERVWRPAGLVAAGTGALIVWTELLYPGQAIPPHAVMALDRMARIAMAWSMVLLLFHLAHRHLNRDHRWRAPLGEAVFPFYLIHHPAIVLSAWIMWPMQLDPWAEFAILLATTLLACTMFYLGGRQIGWLRPWIGLSERPAARRSAPLPA